MSGLEELPADVKDALRGCGLSWIRRSDEFFSRLPALKQAELPVAGTVEAKNIGEVQVHTTGIEGLTLGEEH